MSKLANFIYVPTDIYVEKDCVKNHAQNLLAIGKRAFIMTGRTSAKKNGSLNDVTAVVDSRRDLEDALWNRLMR
ncbi:hypothetical protein [Fibrobacter sp.]